MSDLTFETVVSIGIVGVAAVVVAAVVVVTLRAGRRTAPGATLDASVQGSPAAVRAHQHTTRVAAWAWAWVGSLGALAVAQAVAMATTGTLRFWYWPFAAGRLVGLVPLVAGAGFLLAHVVGEVTWPRPTGMVRHALLVPRSVRDVTGWRLPAWCAALTVLLVAATVVGGVTADSSGRTLTRTDHAWRQVWGNPYPGWYYGVSLLIGVGVLVALTALVLHMLVHRATVGGVHQTDDLALRRRCAGRVLVGVQLVTGTVLAGVLGVAGRTLTYVGSRADDPSAGLMVDLGTVATVTAGVVLAASVGVVLTSTVRGCRPRTGKEAA